METLIHEKLIHFEPDFARGSLKAPTITLQRQDEVASCSLGITFDGDAITHTFDINEVELLEICGKIIEDINTQ